MKVIKDSFSILIEEVKGIGVNVVHKKTDIFLGGKIDNKSVFLSVDVYDIRGIGTSVSNIANIRNKTVD